MKLDVTAQVKLPGSVGKARLSEPFADIEFGGRRISFARPLDIEVTYVYDGESFAVAGTISAVFNSQCARCGEPFEEPLTFEFKERFVRDELGRRRRIYVYIRCFRPYRYDSGQHLAQHAHAKRLQRQLQGQVSGVRMQFKL